MNRQTYPYVTTDSAISLFDRANSYRPILWLDAPGQIDWLNQQDNGLLLRILEMLPSVENEFNQPKYEWIEDTRLEVYTDLANLAAVGDTYLNLTDPYIVVVNSFIVFPADGEICRVEAVDYTKANNWQNAASVVCNVRVTRGIGGTAAVAKVAGDKVLAMPAFNAELSDPNLGVGQLPGQPKYNFISSVSTSFKVSRTQQNSMMYDGWGQVPRAQIEQVLDMRRKLCMALLFQARQTYATANDGQMYISGGALNFIKSNMLDLGSQANKFNWQTLNDFFYALFQPDASSTEKTCLAGENLFRMGLQMARATNNLAEGPYFEPSLGTDAFMLKTDEGNTVNFLKDKYGLAARAGLADWGFVFDMKHISGGHFKGMNFQWLQNIQDNRSYNIREDAYVGSFSLCLKHESCHGVIRGGVGRTVVR